MHVLASVRVVIGLFSLVKVVCDVRVSDSDGEFEKPLTFSVSRKT